jgi:hypothetical protein
VFGAGLACCRPGFLSSTDKPEKDRTMANDELMDPVFLGCLAGHDAGILYARIDDERGMVWQHAAHAGQDDALPRHLLLIADALQKLTEEQPDLVRWETRNGVDGVLWLDEYQWQPLENIGLNQEIGFFDLTLFPSAINDAHLRREDRPYEDD